ncbi:MAG TPA: MFS transporter [Rhizomicrobium sp.]|nr:MFS transporter [Rhizomicrobium sp.]
MQWAASDRCTVEAAKFRQCLRPRLVLVTCILASSLAFIDGSVVNVGLPAIGKDLGGEAADLQWIVNAYLLPLSALLLLGGTLGDRFGRRDILIAGTAMFAIGSALCGAAPSLSWLLVARIVQGGGAALLLPNSLAILGSAFSGEARGRAIGTWSAVSAIAAAIGPVIGGWLIDSVSWRAIFLINLPVAIAAVIMALLYVRDPREVSGGAPLDVAGAALATTALAALTWGLTAGAGRAGWSGAALAAVGAGIILSAAFLWIERQRGDKAMTPLAIFGSRSFIGLTILTLLLYGALGGLLVMVPYVLIQGAHYTATGAGAALLPFPVVVALASPLMGAIAGRVGSRIPLTIGPVIVGIGFLLLLLLTPSSAYWTGVLPAVLVISLGMAGAVAPLTTAVLSSVDARHTGSASGLNSAVARAGGLLATALLGGVLAAQGQPLYASVHIAAIIGAAASLLAGAAAFLLVTGSGSKPAPSGVTRRNARLRARHSRE